MFIKVAIGEHDTTTQPAFKWFPELQHVKYAVELF